MCKSFENNGQLEDANLSTVDILINCSNHPSEKWSMKQQKFFSGAKVIDIGFPNVQAQLNETEVKEMAKELYQKIKGFNPKFLMIQGEYSLCYLVYELIVANTDITVVVPTTERVASEKIVDGKTVKTIEFEFIKWRFL